MDQSFVIVEPNPIVRMDLVGTLEHSFPTGKVTSLEAASEIGQMLENLALSAWFFIDGALMSELAPDVVRAITDAGGKIVSIGRSSSDAISATLLEVPFTMSMILETLTSGGIDLPLPQLEGRT